MLHDPMAVRGICELESEDLSVFLGLLEAVAWILVHGFRFDNSDRKVRTVPQEIIKAFLRSANGSIASDNNPTIGESSLFIDAIVVPTGGVQFWEDILTTSVSFCERSH
jgi:hypothetical protein